MKRKSLEGGIEMLQKLKNLVVKEEGQALTEYGLIIALVAVAVIAAVGLIGTNLNSVFKAITDKLTAK